MSFSMVYSERYILLSSQYLCSDENVHKCCKLCYDFLVIFLLHVIKYTEIINRDTTVCKSGLLLLQNIELRNIGMWEDK